MLLGRLVGQAGAAGLGEAVEQADVRGDDRRARVGLVVDRRRAVVERVGRGLHVEVLVEDRRLVAVAPQEPAAQTQVGHAERAADAGEQQQDEEDAEDRQDRADPARQGEVAAFVRRQRLGREGGRRAGGPGPRWPSGVAPGRAGAVATPAVAPTEAIMTTTNSTAVNDVSPSTLVPRRAEPADPDHQEDADDGTDQGTDAPPDRTCRRCPGHRRWKARNTPVPAATTASTTTAEPMITERAGAGLLGGGRRRACPVVAHHRVGVAQRLRRLQVAGWFPRQTRVPLGGGR